MDNADCITHPGASHDEDGYIRIRRKRDGISRNMGVHRLICAMTHGLDCDDKTWLTRHICGNPGCVNPSHMVPGTPKENAQDTMAHNRTLTGEKNAIAKLTDADIAEIRASNERQVDLAKRFGVSQPRISKIVRREGWSHIP